MIKELPMRNQPLTQFRHKRYFEILESKVRVFGKCEVTDQDYETMVPTAEFFDYLENRKHIKEALVNVADADREFLLSGTSPEGWKILWK